MLILFNIIFSLLRVKVKCVWLGQVHMNTMLFKMLIEFRINVFDLQVSFILALSLFDCTHHLFDYTHRLKTKVFTILAHYIDWYTAT